MKIHKVTIEGFGPFLNKFEVDFDRYENDGLFLIAGNTGAGKSSILDAITYGLYGRTPRFDGTPNIRSDFAQATDKTEVHVEFTAGDQRYRVERTPSIEKPKERGDGVTNTQGNAKLFALTPGGQWEGVVTGLTGVGNKITSLVQLTGDQFLQVMLLAQNQFQEFLLAKSKDRQAILETLFGTGRFAKYEETITNKSKELKDSVTANRTALERVTAQIEAESKLAYLPEQGLPTWLAQVKSAGEAALAEAEANQKLAQGNSTAAQQALAKAEVISAAQKRRDSANATLQTIAENKDQIQDWTDAIAAHQRAVAIAPTIRAWRSAKSAVELAEKTVSELRQKVGTIPSNTLSDNQIQSLQGNPDAPELTVTSLNEIRDTVKEKVTTLKPIFDTERKLPDLEKAVELAAKKYEGTVQARDAAVTQIDTLRTQLTDSQTRSLKLAPSASQIDTHQKAYDDAQAVKKAAEAVTKAEQKVQDAETAAFDAHAQVRLAGEEVNRLWREKIAGAAWDLASEVLTDGQPCPVCGSAEHPEPAVAPSEPVTQEMIDEAQKEQNRKGELATEANQSVAKAAEELAVFKEKARGFDVDTAGVEVDRALAELEASKQAQKDLAAITQQVDMLTTELKNLEAKSAQFASELEALAVAHTAAQTNLQTAKVSVANALSGWDSIGEQLKAFQVTETVVSDLAVALNNLTSTDKTLENSQSALTDALSDQGFASAEKAELATLAKAAADQITADLKRYRDDEAHAIKTLEDPTLADLPTELVETMPLAAAVESAKAVEAQANSDLGALQKGQKTLATYLAEATTLHSEGAKANAEYEVVQRLANSLAGQDPNTRKMKLMNYVLAAELEQIVIAANARLSQMRSGRYTLAHTDELAKGKGQSGLGLVIWDAHTGKPRSTTSLSGGEKFLASLALALGLAETVSNRNGGIKLDTLFIDEGFGTLDPETLETAMETLDNLRQNGRTVGVISHVPEMHERIQAQINVSVGIDGHSQVTQ